MITQRVLITANRLHRVEITGQISIRDPDVISTLVCTCFRDDPALVAFVYWVLATGGLRIEIGPEESVITCVHSNGVQYICQNQ
jgi:hypothetical protein